MKNAPDIPSSNKTINAPAVAATTRRASLNSPKAESMLVNGRPISFKLKKIASADIENQTSVWKGNERIQALLTDNAIADIEPSIRKGGLENPAKGRKKQDGKIEIADGSRRRAACIKSGQDYYIWIGDLTDNDMDHLSKTGNSYKPTSAYERGMRYKSLIESEEYSTLEELANAEKIDRKTMRRYIRTAELPRCIIDLYPTVNDLSARAGESISKVISEKLIEIVENGGVIISEKTPEAITRWLLENGAEKKGARDKIWNDDSLEIKRPKGKKMTITLEPDIPEKIRDKIESFIRKQLDIKKSPPEQVR